MNHSLSLSWYSVGLVKLFQNCLNSYFDSNLNLPAVNMKPFTKSHKIGVVGAGTMGRGIAQIAATNGHSVILVDASEEALQNSQAFLNKILRRLAEKGRLKEHQVTEIFNRIHFSQDFHQFADCSMVIEAVIENFSLKREVFQKLESIVTDNTILATNTSSLSVTSIAGVCSKPERILGAHFFNPAPLMPLVEVVPGLATLESSVSSTRRLLDDWSKSTVLAKDTPGFIVNRVARPFYGEALRILEESIADVATIDWAMREIGGFRMGPFELMDFIGNDVNYEVTKSVFEAFYYEPRYRPSFTQKRMVEAGRLGRKTDRGYYDYNPEATPPKPEESRELGEEIFNRILVMLINEAADAVFYQIASREDIDLAMTKGVNYPKGLLQWADEIGLQNVLNRLTKLQNEYGEERYRPSPLIKRLVKQGKRFYT